MKFKRILCILLVVLLIVSLAIAGTACKKKPGNNSSNTTIDKPGGDPTTDPTTDPTKDPSDDPSEDPTTDPTEDPSKDPTEDPDKKDASLAVPTSLAVDVSGGATWTRVQGASGYEVNVNGNVLSRRFTNCNLLDVPNLPVDGRFVIKVRAVSDKGHSDWCAAVTFVYQGGAVVTPQVSGLTGKVLSWSVPQTNFAGIAKPYPVVTIAGTENVLASDVGSFDLSSIETKSSVSLKYVADGHYYTDSVEVKFVYDPSAKTPLSFAAPTSAYMDGDMLYFSEVVGANIYYFKDVYNTVTTLSGSEANALCSDRAGHFLVKEIWAGNKDLPIGDSDPCTVTFFNAEQGKGTEIEPFLISSAAHLRFIEFYEALGQPKYYKLTKDIAFTPYQPQKDEDYSNFYNLGSLSGVLDGDGHTISNIVVWYKDGYSSIFDSITKDGVIKNIKIADTSWMTWTNRTNDGIMHEKGGECAILAYTNNGLIENVTLVSGNVQAVKDGAAGLVSINRGTIKDCSAEAAFTVYGANEAGAFAIYNAGTIEHCLNYATISGKTSVGGIVGRNAGIVTKCSNHGPVFGELYTGGIVGYNYNIKDVDGKMQYNTMVSYCSNTAEVEGFSFTGGIVGRNGSNGYNEVGSDNYANVGLYGCYNRGTVSGIISIGGIAGQNFAYYGGVQDAGFGLRACYNSGEITSGDEGFRANFLYLSVAACSWAEVDETQIFAYVWKGESDAPAAWPGSKMTKTKVGEAEFYCLEMPSGYATNQLAGVIFNRVDPNNNSNVFNQTSNITAISSTTSAVYYVNGDWSNANLSEPCWGAITGYNNQIDTCYYIYGSKVGGANVALNATQSDSVGATAVSAADLRGASTALNTALGGEYFVAVENQYPILKWESVDQQIGGGQ